MNEAARDRIHSLSVNNKHLGSIKKKKGNTLPAELLSTSEENF
jgi:hypothetical protein